MYRLTSRLAVSTPQPSRAAICRNDNPCRLSSTIRTLRSARSMQTCDVRDCAFTRSRPQCPIPVCRGWRGAIGANHARCYRALGTTHPGVTGETPYSAKGVTRIPETVTASVTPDPLRRKACNLVTSFSMNRDMYKEGPLREARLGLGCFSLSKAVSNPRLHGYTVTSVSVQGICRNRGPLQPVTNPVL
jgi:hypothetical protein